MTERVSSKFADIISRTGGKRPAPYNRRWHCDEDRRRHHGRRTWDAGTLDALVNLIGDIDGLYPPDWSDPNLIRCRLAGTSSVAVEIATDDPDQLRVTIESRRVVDLAPLRRILGPALRKLRCSGGPRYQVSVNHLEPRQIQAVATLMNMALSIMPAPRRRSAATRSSPR